MLSTEMLRTRDAIATVGVKNLARAKKFYGDTLGLEQIETREPEVAAFRTGQSRLLVYTSEHAGTNRATSVTWNVGDDVDDVVRALKEEGVTFEHYEMPGTTLEGDVHVSGTMRVAWFKDPDGNILCLVSG